jgi:hypothetical protein
MVKGEKRAKKKNIRTETIGFRLEPKLRFAAELAARKQRRSLSNFIEWAVEEAVKNVTLGRDQRSGGEKTAYDAIQSVWDVDEADRFINLASSFSYLLTHEEEILSKLIISSGVLWKGHYDSEGKWVWHTDPSVHLIYDRLREHWETLKKVASGELSKDHIPQVEDREIDEDIPF